MLQIYAHGGLRVAASCDGAGMRYQRVWALGLVLGCGGGRQVGAGESIESKAAKPVVLPQPAAASAAATAEREEFATATPGALPPGWAVSDWTKAAAFTVAPGDHGALLQVVSEVHGAGAITRRLDLARYRGKRIQITAHAMCEPHSWRLRATVGVNVLRAGRHGDGDRARSEEFKEGPWRDYSVIADVTDDAAGLELTVDTWGPATTRISSISIVALGEAGAGDEPPRVLAGRALDNVIAFARLYGIVRYFHPSDEAAALDDAGWEHFLVRGVRGVERSPDADALRAKLAELFAPIAPTVVVRGDAETMPSDAAIDPHALHWHHTGLGLSGDPYHSARETIGTAKEQLVQTAVEVSAVRGKAIALTMRARSQLKGDGARAGLSVHEYLATGGDGFATEPGKQPAISEHWSEIRVQGQLSENTGGLYLGVQLRGGGEAWFELPSLVADGKPVAIHDWGAAGHLLADEWEESGGQSFALEVTDQGCEPHHRCLHATSRPVARPDVRPWTGSLGGGVAAWVPLALSTQDGKTVPAATVALPDSQELLRPAADRATRLAAVIVAWNVFEHFYSYFDVRGTDWMTVLGPALAQAAVDDGQEAFHATLRRLVHALYDGHGAVFHPSANRTWFAPWTWQWLEGRLVISHVSDGCVCDLRPGDAVVAIAQTPTAQAISAASDLSSYASEQYRIYAVLRSLRRGPERGRLRITVERGGAAHDVEAALVSPADEPEDPRPQSGTEIAPGIRYIDIDHLTEEQWTQILPQVATAKAVVCDMRSYPVFDLTATLEHFTQKPMRSAHWRIPTLARPDREGMVFGDEQWKVFPKAPFIAHVVFLTDSSAISAAETYMGIVESYKLGPIVGSATAGTNGDVDPFHLPGSYKVWWTGMRVLKQDGSRHHGVGIQPTVPASPTLAGIAAGRDEVLEKGIEVAKRLIATGATPRR